ncbi:Glycosyl transferase, family 10 [Ostreococcus tauri]|uniref:Fucosyltransferase n=1 Tax=Ostreococcus tauri TaxID=70448 RepID=A0A096P7V8_OSTTA|nr:Glycosyl transferase, family 10 [Ostreococcus tauri]CEG00068.1 Glycosyl transferase, family 10 [Ostreococcus tauri]|eukprot:XP_003082568.2 Glycosyl transferase, family 10 [Ostreococcus tauri]
MDPAERAPLLQPRAAEVHRARVHLHARARGGTTSSARAVDANTKTKPNALGTTVTARGGRYSRAVLASALVVMAATMLTSGTVSFVRRAGRATAEKPPRARAVGVAARARETLRTETLGAYAWLLPSDGRSGIEGAGRLGRSERARAGTTYETEDPLEAELARNAHALDRARTVEDFVAMSVQVDDAHAVGRKPLREWAHAPALKSEEAARARGTNLEFGDEAFTVCLYNLHQWSRPLGSSTWAEDLATVLDAKRGVKSAATANLMGRCVKDVMHTNGRSDSRCMDADVVVFRGDSMVSKMDPRLGNSAESRKHSEFARARMARMGANKARVAKLGEPRRASPSGRGHSQAPSGDQSWDHTLTRLPSKRRRDQVYVYVSTAAPASEKAGKDLRDRNLLSQVDYLASSNPALESVWRSPLPSAKFMISSYDAFLRPWRMRLPVIGFGDSATACKHGRSPAARILQKISERWPVWSHGSCMHNYNSTAFIPNLSQSMSSAEAIRTQLDLSRYLFYFVAEDVDCPGHVTEKLWLPLLRGSIPIYFGTKTVDDYLPCPNKDCVLRVKDFNSVHELVDRMKSIASDESLYASLTQWRHQVPSMWPEKFRQGVARSSRDIQGVVCDIMRDGSDANKRGSISAFASAAPAEAPWLLDSYPNRDIDMDVVESLERSGERSDAYCVRQDRVRALGEVFSDPPSTASTQTTTTTSVERPTLRDPTTLYAVSCDADYVGCGRLLID